MTLQGTQHDEAPVLSTPIGPRRRFFAWVTTAVMGVIGIGLTIPLIGYVAGPVLKRREALWNEIGPIDRLRAGEPEEVSFITAMANVLIFAILASLSVYMATGGAKQLV